MQFDDAAVAASSGYSNGRGKKRRQFRVMGVRPGIQKNRRYGQAYLPRETKYVDGYKDLTAIHELSANDDTWADTEMNPIQQTSPYGCMPVPRQGTNYSDRDGRRIVIKSIRVSGTIQFDPTNGMTSGSTEDNYVRLVMVLNTRTCGTELSGENVLGPGIGSDGQASLTGDAAINAFSNPDGWGQFKIVKDKYIRRPERPAFNDGTDGAISSVTVPFKISVKCNTIVNFDASTGAVGSIVDNSYSLLAGCGPHTNDCKITYVARTAFQG